MLKLFYITNNPDVAEIAQACGVDRIFVDMEYIGKDLRQGGLDTVKNHHTINDIKNIRRVVDKSELLVRVNPLHKGSKEEIDAAAEAGADVIMLPMWKTPDDVQHFLDLVGGRAKTLLLLETKEAMECVDEVISQGGFDEVHIGLNDLSLSLGRKFLFELLTDGTVDFLAEKFRKSGVVFGFGGFGRVFHGGLLPAENIVAEHYRLKSSAAILSRAFCNTSKITDIKEIEEIFSNGLKDTRDYEKELEKKSPEFFDELHKETAEIIRQIVSAK